MLFLTDGDMRVSLYVRLWISCYLSACDVTMTYHRSKDQKRQLTCHYCGHERPPQICPQCGGDQVGGVGIGTQQTEQAFLVYFQQASVRMDQDTTTGRLSHHDILHSFQHGEADVLIRTQMIAKGHDFPTVTVVGILLADRCLDSMTFVQPACFSANYSGRWSSRKGRQTAMFIFKPMTLITMR